MLSHYNGMGKIFMATLHLILISLQKHFKKAEKDFDKDKEILHFYLLCHIGRRLNGGKTMQ